MMKLLSISVFLVFTFHFCPPDAMAQRPVSMAAVSGARSHLNPNLWDVLRFLSASSPAATRAIHHTWQPANQPGWMSTWPATQFSTGPRTTIHTGW